MASSLGCAYVVDTDPRFLRMLRISVQGVRAQDATIPIVVLVTETDPAVVAQADLHVVGSLVDEIRLVAPLHTHTGYYPDNKAHLAALEFDRVVYLDADTFVFGSLTALAHRYRSFDVSARPNEWVHRYGYRAALAPDLLCILNSGVVVASKEVLRHWATHARARARTLLTDPRRAGLVAWMHQMSAKAYHREEVAFSELVWSGAWSVGLMSDADCHLLERWPEQEDPRAWRRATVLHTFSSQWERCARRLAGESNGGPRAPASVPRDGVGWSEPR